MIRVCIVFEWILPAVAVQINASIDSAAKNTDYTNRCLLARARNIA